MKLQVALSAIANRVDVLNLGWDSLGAAMFSNRPFLSWEKLISTYRYDSSTSTENFIDIHHPNAVQ